MNIDLECQGDIVDIIINITYCRTIIFYGEMVLFSMEQNKAVNEFNFKIIVSNVKETEKFSLVKDLKDVDFENLVKDVNEEKSQGIGQDIIVNLVSNAIWGLIIFTPEIIRKISKIITKVKNDHICNQKSQKLTLSCTSLNIEIMCSDNDQDINNKLQTLKKEFDDNYA